MTGLGKLELGTGAGSSIGEEEHLSLPLKALQNLACKNKCLPTNNCVQEPGLIL